MLSPRAHLTIALARYGYPHRRRFWPAVADAARQMGREFGAELRTVVSPEPVGIWTRVEALARIYIGAIVLVGIALLTVALPVVLLVALLQAHY